MGLGKKLLSPITGPLKSINRGFDTLADLPDAGIASLARFRPSIGGAAIGAGAGAFISSRNPEAGAAESIGTGAAIGALAMPVTGMALGAGYLGLKGGAKVAKHSAPYLASGAGHLARGGASVGKGMISGPGIKGTSFAAKAANSALSPVSRYANTANKALGNFADFKAKTPMLDKRSGKIVRKGGLKIKPLGWGVLGAGAAISATRGGIEAYDNNRIGQGDGMVHRATPRLPAYSDNAGATGDLAFALHNNRRG